MRVTRLDKKETYKLTNKLLLISCLVTFYLFYTEIVQADEPKQPNETISQSYDPLDPAILIEPVLIEEDDDLNLTISFEDSDETEELENIPDGTEEYLVSSERRKEKQGNQPLNQPDAIVVGNDSGGSGKDPKETSYLAELCFQLSGTVLFGTRYNEC